MKSYFKFVKLLKCSTNGFGQFCFQIRLVLMETSTATNCRVCKPYKTPFEHSFILKTEGQWQWVRGMSGCLDFGPLNLKPAGDDMNPFQRGETCGHLSHHGFDRLESLVVEVVCMEVEQAAGLGLLHGPLPPAQRCLLWMAPKAHMRKVWLSNVCTFGPWCTLIQLVNQMMSASSQVKLVCVLSHRGRYVAPEHVVAPEVTSVQSS